MNKFKFFAMGIVAAAIAAGCGGKGEGVLVSYR
jgi:hypothetical protein